MWNQATELEIIMREELLNNEFFFDEQVYVRKDQKHFEFDFVVYGEYCKIVVECDGPHHYQASRWYKDLLRDLWTVNSDFQDVLRFNYYQIRNSIDECIQSIRTSITELDQALSHEQSRKERINVEKEAIRNRKNSHFYIGEKPKNEFSGIKVDIPQKSPEELFTHEKFIMRGYHVHTNIFDYVNKERPRLSEEALSSMYRTEEPIEVEEGIKIPRREIKYYKLMKNLSIQDKKLLWMFMQNASRDSYYIYRGKRESIENLCNLDLLLINDFYRGSSREISVKVLPSSPYLLKAYLRK
jgi:very-short-patch-repair endonuclease